MALYYPFQSPWPLLRQSPANHVHWTLTPDSHLYTALLPGTRKEEIRVELEDSTYLVIRTDRGSRDEGNGDFMRKFRLPELVDLEGIAAEFEDGELRITVPRITAARRRAELMRIAAAEEDNAGAPAA